MKTNLSHIAMTTVLVIVILALVLAPIATTVSSAARGGMGGGGGGMGFRTGMGGGGMGFRTGMGGGGMGRGFDRDFGRGRFFGGGFNRFGRGWWWNRPWWNNWWGGGWWGGSICPYWNCVNMGYGPQYCASVCGVY